ncbi:MAG: hypothetical protein QXS91_02970 [Candidatus Anstonellales archaeon]
MGFGIFRERKKTEEAEGKEKSKIPQFKELNRIKKQERLATLIGAAVIIPALMGYSILKGLKEEENRRKEAAIQRICNNDAAKLKNILKGLRERYKEERGSKKTIWVRYHSNNGKAVEAEFEIKELRERIDECYKAKQNEELLFDENTGTLEVK